ncbi:hypothetical protein ACF0H5_013527 [Mactra antiquata]
MEYSMKNLSISVAMFVCMSVAVTTAIPLYNDIDLSEYVDTCKTCFIVGDNEACLICNLVLEEALAEKDDVVDSSIQKRSMLYHPLLRGGYPKKSSYTPYYNPLNRGSYFKKSYTPPAYHPFLRGGYRAPTVQRNYWNAQNDDDELP